ncbi:C39 family peptidase [Paenibacillus sp. IB182496]|uniref:C39 family peptidase n=1 Tax=Paenibacillus sabuli TaxID=2772509 RepID=A0A927BXH5_9BACL|nr:C39 family peptidase [Paenibacillus sabuli]
MVWAASSVSILKHFGIDELQCAFAINIRFGEVTCDNTSENIDNVLDGFVMYYGVSAYKYTGSLTWSELKTEIDNGRPIYVSWGWSTGGGHAVVIYGYSQSGTYVNHMNPASTQ